MQNKQTGISLLLAGNGKYQKAYRCESDIQAGR